MILRLFLLKYPKINCRNKFTTFEFDPQCCKTVAHTYTYQPGSISVASTDRLDSDNEAVSAACEPKAGTLHFQQCVFNSDRLKKS